jgi:hypothetical protein
MKKYFYTDGFANFGPFTLEELKYKNITLDTNVWYEGMGDWKKAAEVPELASLFSTNTAIPPSPPNPFQTGQSPSNPTNNPYNDTQNMIPKTWLVESILVTVLCCLPFGIAGIINAAKVESRYYAGDLEGAQRASDEAKKWTKIGFIISIAMYAVYILLMVFGLLGSIFNYGD